MTRNDMLISNSEFPLLREWVLADSISVGSPISRDYSGLLQDTVSDLLSNGHVNPFGAKRDKLILTIKGRRYLRDLLRFED